MGMKTVAIIGALDEEVALIAKSLTHVTHTAKGSLDDHRITNPVSFLFSCVNIQNRPLRPRDHRNTGCFHGVSGFLLVSKTADHRRGRPYKDNAALFTYLCETGIFR